MFATPGGLIGPSKGSDLMLETLERLHAAGLAGRFRLRVLGPVHPTARPRLAEFPELELAGEYDRWALDTLLDDVDVGIMPSVWEEAYGYAGLELLAKGIPVVANRIGGMVDYVREGETGWLERLVHRGGHGRAARAADRAPIRGGRAQPGGPRRAGAADRAVRRPRRTQSWPPTAKRGWTDSRAVPGTR